MTRPLRTAAFAAASAAFIAFGLTGAAQAGPMRPLLSSMTPDTGATAGGDSISLVGANLLGAEVTIGGQVATSDKFVGIDTLIVLTPVYSGGGRLDLEVTATNDGETSDPLLFSYNAPTITFASIVDGVLTVGGADFGTHVGSMSVVLAGHARPLITLFDSLLTASVGSGFSDGPGWALTLESGGTISNSFFVENAVVVPGPTPALLLVSGLVAAAGLRRRAVRRSAAA